MMESPDPEKVPSHMPYRILRMMAILIFFSWGEV
jgi:hypothetical protein